MTDTAGAPITVGVDGSPSSLEAVLWAAGEAHRHRRPLSLVHANNWPTYANTMWPSWGPPARRDGRVTGQEVLKDAAERAALVDPGTVVITEVIDGGPASVLLERAERSTLLVVGRHGVSGVADLLIGSVAAQVATYAPCPVAVVPLPPVPETADGAEASAPGVVLGVDGSTECQDAIDYAFAEASMRGLPVTAVRSWLWPADDPAIVEPFPPEPADRLAEQQRLISEGLAGWSEKYPDVPVRHVVAHHRPARALVDAARGAELLVVGARGSGGFRNLLLGSVGETLIRHATCPVVVVRSIRPTH